MKVKWTEPHIVALRRLKLLAAFVCFNISRGINFADESILNFRDFADELTENISQFSQQKTTH